MALSDGEIAALFVACVMGLPSILAALVRIAVGRFWIGISNQIFLPPCPALPLSPAPTAAAIGDAVAAALDPARDREEEEEEEEEEAEGGGGGGRLDARNVLQGAPQPSNYGGIV
ncbi:hypothetical protein PG984_011423 [Apiospora sp. TS-2023a]